MSSSRGRCPAEPCQQGPTIPSASDLGARPFPAHGTSTPLPRRLTWHWGQSPLPAQTYLGSRISPSTSTHRTRALQKVRAMSKLDWPPRAPLLPMPDPGPKRARTEQSKGLALTCLAQDKTPALSSQQHL